MVLIIFQVLAILLTGVGVCIWGDWHWGLLILLGSKIYMIWASVTYDPDKPKPAEEPRYVSPEVFWANEREKKRKECLERLRYRGRRTVRPTARPTAHRVIATCAACHTSYAVADSNSWETDVHSSRFTPLDDDSEFLESSTPYEWPIAEAIEETNTINPANGLLCVNDIDIKGNLYGTDSHVFDNSNSFDDGFSSYDDGISGFDDCYSSSFDDSFSSVFDD